MGKRGPKPQPSIRKIISGAAKKNPARMNKREPKLMRGWPKPPKSLSKAAAEYWEEFCGIIDAHQVLTPQHGRAVREMCEVYVRLEEARDQVNKEGIVLTGVTAHGEEKCKAHPAVAIELSMSKRFTDLLAEFGCTPASASKVNALENGISDARDSGNRAPNGESSFFTGDSPPIQ